MSGGGGAPQSSTVGASPSPRRRHCSCPLCIRTPPRARVSLTRPLWPGTPGPLPDRLLLLADLTIELASGWQWIHPLSPTTEESKIPPLPPPPEAAASGTGGCTAAPAVPRRLAWPPLWGTVVLVQQHTQTYRAPQAHQHHHHHHGRTLECTWPHAQAGRATHRSGQGRHSSCCCSCCCHWGATADLRHRGSSSPTTQNAESPSSASDHRTLVHDAGGREGERVGR